MWIEITSAGRIVKRYYGLGGFATHLGQKICGQQWKTPWLFASLEGTELALEAMNSHLVCLRRVDTIGVGLYALGAVHNSLIRKAFRGSKY
jgi:hypothetical protein